MPVICHSGCIKQLPAFGNVALLGSQISPSSPYIRILATCGGTALLIQSVSLLVAALLDEQAAQADVGAAVRGVHG